jgi:hypothetical protein
MACIRVKREKTKLLFCGEEEKNAADLDPLFPFFLHEWTFPSRSYLTCPFLPFQGRRIIDLWEL